MPYEPTPPTIDAGSLSDQLDNLVDQLTAHNINLTKDERSNANSIDDDRLGFVEDYYGNKGDYPNLLPPFMNEADADAHNTVRTDLSDIMVKAARVVELAGDIQINSEHHTMEYGYEGYAVVGRAKEKNVPGADTFYDLLSRHFEGMGNPGEPDPDPGTPVDPAEPIIP